MWCAARSRGTSFERSSRTAEDVSGPGEVGSGVARAPRDVERHRSGAFASCYPNTAAPATALRSERGPMPLPTIQARTHAGIPRTRGMRHPWHRCVPRDAWTSLLSIPPRRLPGMLFGLFHLGPGRVGRPGRGEERVREDLVEGLDAVEPERGADLLGDVLQVGLILLRQDELLDPGAVGAEHLLLDASDRQDAAAQGDLAGHRDVPAHGAAGHGRD